MIWIALVGATLVLVNGVGPWGILKRLRALWPSLLDCAQCTGMWVGIAAGASGVASTGHGWILDALIAGAATSFLSLAAYAILFNLLGDPNDKE